MVDTNILKKLNILYVEDELSAAKKFTKILSKFFHNVYTAYNGKEGLDIFENKNIDLVISDINMPVMDGLEMSQNIRETCNDVPIILTTARTETDCLIKAIELNINSYILKPVFLNDLVGKLNLVAQKLQFKETENILGQYKQVVDLSSIVMKFDLNGKITYVNDRFTKISKYSQAEVKDEFFNFNTHKETPSKQFLEIWETIEKKEIWKGKLKNYSKENSTYIVDTTILPILDINKDIKEYICVSNDITDEEALNNLLKNEVNNYKGNLEKNTHILNEYKRSLEESSILIKLNKEYQIIFMNRKLFEISQFKRKDLIKKDFFEIFECEQNDLFEIFASLDDKKSIQKELKLKVKDGKYKHIQIFFSPIYSDNENIEEFLLLGTDISQSIELFEEIEETQKDVIFSLGSIGEYRSKETGNHVKRVANYSYLIAKKLGLSEKEAQLIKTASPMHDIGKVAISDSILHKHDKLTKEEFEIMKTHTTIGYNMLRNSSREILQASATVAHEHHERWDGTGYPRALKGEEIHIFGRITSVADVFDALGSDRCYKKAWPLVEVLDFLNKESGKYFDPKIVDILLNNIDEFLEIKNKFKD